MGRFPFGEEVRTVVQADRSPKRVFVLGVYASAVHARWVGPDGKQRVKALAVASEPYIFWRGECAEEAIDRIPIPEDLGRLEPAQRALNGPSGTALDDLYLAPLGLSRKDAWLCDVVPHSCTSASQDKAIAREYLPLIQQFQLTQPTVPPRPTAPSSGRGYQIMDEIRESEAEILVLLGDEPIKWFLFDHLRRWRKLSDFENEGHHYGELHPVQMDGVKLHVLPLVHPRQAAGLGSHSGGWRRVHADWCNRPCRL